MMTMIIKGKRRWYFYWQTTRNTRSVVNFMYARMRVSHNESLRLRANSIYLLLQCKREYKLWFPTQFAVTFAFEFSINFIKEYCWFSFLMHFLILYAIKILYHRCERGRVVLARRHEVSNNRENCIDSSTNVRNSDVEYSYMENMQRKRNDIAVTTVFKI